MEYIKRSSFDAEAEDNKIRQVVEEMLARIRLEGEAAVIEYARDLDNWSKPFVLTEEKKQRLIAQVSEADKSDIRFAYEQVKRFALAQKSSLKEFSTETEPGVTLGQRIVPVSNAGCYVPGGRYAHVSSAIMSVATAKVAGVPFVMAASPPQGDSINPQTAYAMDIAGADMILEMGGVQAIASMAFGLFGTRPADLLVGPGNAYVAEAKRLLFGQVGIDVFAGPTESAIIADETADPMTVALDLAGQAEHGVNSPVWLFTTSRKLAEAIYRIMQNIADTHPSGEVIKTAWHNHGEIILCENRDEVCKVSDSYASEHLQVIANDLGWWKQRLKNYGSLFLGEGASVAHGDKCSGTNHILPTKGAARYAGGLNVMKFLKVLTWQEISEEANLKFSAVASRLSRLEGMESHARSVDWRLKKYYPEKVWDFDVAEQKRYE